MHEGGMEGMAFHPVSVFARPFPCDQGWINRDPAAIRPRPVP